VASGVLVVDDHPVFCTAMSMVVSAAEEAAEIIGVADLASAERLMRERSYDLVLLDLSLPDVQGMSGLLLLRQLQPSSAIAIVSAREEARLMRQAAACGARGYIPKSTPVDVMVTAVNALLVGGQWFPQSVLNFEMSDDQRELGARFAELSVAQIRVLRAIADGRLNKQIAHDLGIAEATVKSHLQTIFRKLGVPNRMQAVIALNSLDLQAD
jgi:DNA-binding NarL/FixJ family response regulator